MALVHSDPIRDEDRLTVGSATPDGTIRPPGQADEDCRAGSSDIRWAERAYRTRSTAPEGRSPWWRRPLRHRVRLAVAGLTVVLVAIGLAVGFTSPSSSPAPIAHRATPALTPAPTEVGPLIPETQPLVRPLPPLLSASGGVRG